MSLNNSYKYFVYTYCVLIENDTPITDFKEFKEVMGVNSNNTASTQTLNDSDFVYLLNRIAKHGVITD